MCTPSYAKLTLSTPAAIWRKCSEGMTIGARSSSWRLRAVSVSSTKTVGQLLKLRRRCVRTPTFSNAYLSCGQRYIDQYKITTAGEHNQQVFRQQYVLLQHGLRDVIKDMWPTEDMSWPNLDQVHVGNACEREADVHGSPSSLPMPQPASSSIPPPAQGVPTFRTSNPASHPSENSSASTYGIPSESAALLKDASPSSSRSPRATLCMAPLAQGLPNDCILNQSSHPSEDSYASADAIASQGAPHSRDFGTLASEYQKQYGKPPTSGNCEWSQQQLRASFTEQPTHLRQATLIALQKACSLVPSATLSSDLCTI